MKKIIVGIIFLCSVLSILINISFAQNNVQLNEDKQDSVFNAQMQYIAAWTSFAVYNDKLGNLADDILTKYGWQTERINEKIDKSDVKLLVASKQIEHTPIYFLSVSGTNSWLDVKTDFKVQSVVFAGKTDSEFAEFMRSENIDKSEPQVHKGFAQYVQDGFFTRQKAAYDNLTLGDFIVAKLKQNPNAKLYITGHSLGGAAAEVLAARLLEMGVNANQLEIITFGAPAVGNQAFVDEFEPQMNLTRITIKGDPVKNLAQIANDRLVQFKQNTVWNLPWSEDDKFAHGMLLYFDGAMREYYNLKTFEDKQFADYAVNISFDFPEELKGEEVYIQSALADKLQMEQKNAVFIEDNTDIFAKAKQYQAKYVVFYRYEAKLLKDNTSNKRYYINCTKYVYNIEGKFIKAESASTDTNDMTVVQAALYTNYQLEK